MQQDNSATQPTMKLSQSAPAAPAVVLDTNAVLDWLLFHDPGMGALQTAIGAGAVRWLASPRMREELLRTLHYPALAKWQPDRARALAVFDRWAATCPEPAPTRIGPFVCRDPDDQVFIDLALAQSARWLVTHDRALHQLARRAALAEVRILRPKEWSGP